MRYRILYVEDELILGQLVTEALQKNGYEVLKLTVGTRALQAYREFKPHLLLLDIMLPGKDGYEIAEQLRAIDKKVPIIFLTAKIQTTDLVAGFRAGCNDYIRKPFSMDELVLRLNSWLHERYGMDASQDESEQDIDGYRFFPKTQMLQTPEGITIQLTFKEARVLALLNNHRNRILSRESILQHVWGNEGLYNSRTLDVYINKLRKYFGNDANRILTLKGVGYRFICQ